MNPSIEQLSKFVIPIYEHDARGRPSHCGSGFFIRRGKSHYLISAAHVLKESIKKQLFYFIAPDKTVLLTGTVTISCDVDQVDGDLVDVGIVKLDGKHSPPYPLVDKFPCDIYYLSPARYPRQDRHYVIIGYPASRNKFNPVKDAIAARPHSYRSYSIADEAYADYDLSPETHIAMPLDLKIGFDSTGKHRNFPNPEGMSGSPIWELFNDNSTNESKTFSLVGIFTTYYKKRNVLFGSDVQAVLQLLEDA